MDSVKGQRPSRQATPTLKRRAWREGRAALRRRHGTRVSSGCSQPRRGCGINHPGFSGRRSRFVKIQSPRSSFTKSRRGGWGVGCGNATDEGKQRGAEGGRSAGRAARTCIESHHTGRRQVHSIGQEECATGAPLPVTIRIKKTVGTTPGARPHQREAVVWPRQWVVSVRRGVVATSSPEQSRRRCRERSVPPGLDPNEHPPGSDLASSSQEGTRGEHSHIFTLLSKTCLRKWSLLAFLRVHRPHCIPWRPCVPASCHGFASATPCLRTHDLGALGSRTGLAAACRRRPRTPPRRAVGARPS